MRFARRAASCLCLCVALGWHQAPAPRRAVAQAQPPMEPLRPREAPAPPSAPSPPAIERTLVQQVYRLGWHRMLGMEVLEGPLVVEGVEAVPGDRAVQALGRTFRRCRTSTGAHGTATWCPGVGVVASSRRERGGTVERTVRAIRRGGETWAASPCDVMHFVPDEARARACDRPIRTLGSGPRPAGDGCEWRYTLDGPAASEAVVVVRLARDAARIDGWGEAPRTRTSTARAGGWSAGVRVRTDRCGAADAEPLARSLAALGPSPASPPR